jgi:hypothetical protein
MGSLPRAKKDNQLAISLKKQAKEVMLASHTEDATMNIDAEINDVHLT